LGLRVEIFRSKTELVIVLRFSGSRGRCPGGGRQMSDLLRATTRQMSRSTNVDLSTTPRTRSAQPRSRPWKWKRGSEDES